MLLAAVLKPILTNEESWLSMQKQRKYRVPLAVKGEKKGPILDSGLSGTVPNRLRPEHPKEAKIILLECLELVQRVSYVDLMGFKPSPPIMH